RLLTRMTRAVSRRYKVATALSGTQALRAIQDKRPDAIFLDLVMPEIDGYALIETIRNQPDLADILVVAVSAQTLSRRPLTSDGLVFLRSDGISVSSLIDCLRQGLSLLPRSEEAEASYTAPTSDGFVLAP